MTKQQRKNKGTIDSLTSIPILLQASWGQPNAELKVQVETFLRGYDFSGAQKDAVFVLADALLFSDLTPLVGELAPQLDLSGYRLATQPFHSLRRHTGKVITALFAVVPALIEAGMDPHESRSGLSLADWLTEYAFDDDATMSWQRPRHTDALALMDYTPSLAAIRRPEKFLYQLAHLGGERAIRETLARTGWDIDSNFDTPVVPGFSTGRPALGLAAGYRDLPAVQCLLACGASPSIPIHDYRRTRKVVPLVEYAAHYPQEIRAALEGAYLDAKSCIRLDNDTPIGL